MENRKKESTPIDLKYKWLQIAVATTGFIGTTALSFVYFDTLVYLFSMLVFTIFNILQIIHFTLRKIYIETGSYVYFLLIGITGVYNYVSQNYNAIIDSINKIISFFN